MACRPISSASRCDAWPYSVSLTKLVHGWPVAEVSHGVATSTREPVRVFSSLESPPRSFSSRD